MVNVYTAEGTKSSVDRWLGHNKITGVALLCMRANRKITWFQQWFNNKEETQQTMAKYCLDASAACGTADHNITFNSSVPV